METSEVEIKDFKALSTYTGMVFTPSSPISDQKCFAGRKAQLHRILDVIFNEGQHAILYGERGVGKTSIANILHSVLSVTSDDKYLVSKINCDSKDDFKTVWVKILRRVPFVLKESLIGFSSGIEEKIVNIGSLFENKSMLTPEDIRMVGELGSHLIFIFDEFDRIQNKDVSSLFADTIKNLSDYSSRVTIILVGVADNISELIREHASINRCMIQILMPRMERGELTEILVSGSQKLQVNIDSHVIKRIVDLSQGLPHYTHLLARSAVRAACERMDRNVVLEDLQKGIKLSIADAQHSTIAAYTQAISSQKKNTWFKDVLLACALAPTDELGLFAPSDVKPLLEKILKKQAKLKSQNLEISAFVKHLTDFSGKSRGEIFKKSGEKRKFRYRFSDPLMQPYVIMRGFDENLLSSEDFAE